MVNYRRVVCEVALIGALVALTTAAPASDCKHTHYDQRQNGTENIRVSVDGIVVALVPAEGLISAIGGVDDLMEILSFEDFSSDSKPKPPQTFPAAIDLIEDKPKPEDKPSVEKPAEEKPLEEKPSEDKPQQLKSVISIKHVEDTPLSDVHIADEEKKKEISTKKQEKSKRLKNRLAAFLLPLLKKTRQH